MTPDWNFARSASGHGEKRGARRRRPGVQSHHSRSLRRLRWPRCRPNEPGRTRRRGQLLLTDSSQWLHHIARDRLQPPADRRHRTVPRVFRCAGRRIRDWKSTARPKTNTNSTGPALAAADVLGQLRSFRQLSSGLPVPHGRRHNTPPAPPPPEQWFTAIGRSRPTFGRRNEPALAAGPRLVVPADGPAWRPPIAMRITSCGDSARNARVRRRARLVRHRSQAWMSSDCATPPQGTIRRGRHAVFANTSASPSAAFRPAFVRRIRSRAP